MAQVPYYRIIGCCGNFGQQFVTLSNLPGTGFVSGLYDSNVDIQLTSGQPDIEKGLCYVITLAGFTNDTTLPVVDFSVLTLLEAGSSTNCIDYTLYESPGGCACDWIYTISPCCPEHGSQGSLAQYINIDSVDETTFISGDVFTYGGASTVTFLNSNLKLVPGACYTITREENLTPTALPIVVDYSDFGYVGTAGTGCEDAACLDCEAPGISYLKYTECCLGKEIFRRTDTYLGAPGGSVSSTTGPIVDIASYLGVVQFNGSMATSKTDFLIGQCYEVTLHTLGSEAPGGNTPQTEADYNNLPVAPYSTEFDQTGTQCEEAPCPDCNPLIYQLTNCEGVSILTDSDLSAEVGTFVELDGISGCWQVQLNSPIVSTPIDSSVKPSSRINSEKAAVGVQIPYLPNVLPGLQTQPVTVTGPCAGCDCKCYEVTGYTGVYSYIDCDGITRTVMSSGSERFCASARPDVKGIEGVDYVITEGDDCVDDQCVDKCFLLTNCDPSAYPTQDATITSTLQSLSQYLNTSSVVVLTGYDGCWTVTEATECDCPVDVTVIRDHRDCEECLGITAYKLSNCEKINEVLYTLQDFSAYVGKVIKDECACWIVEEIDYQPPSETTIVDPIAFEDCNACLTTYYTLTDCDDKTSVIISSTNLSAYVGQVVKIEGCTSCYEVTLYVKPIAPQQWQEVTVTEASATCFDCKQLVPRCSTVFNNSTEDRTFTYINANGDSEETEVVKSGHFSLRTCVQYWDEPDTFIYNYYGDCSVFEYINVITPGECNCIDVTIAPITGAVETYLALHTGQFYNGKKVYDLTVDGIPYFIWSEGVIGDWYISDELGTADLSNTIGDIKSGFPDCPIAAVGAWSPGRLPPGTSADAVLSIETTEGTCPPGTTVKEGHCIQHFPNNRKVKPGYNTPICSAEKYDKITCRAADIMYKKALELRYGISNCCPEEDEKWLIQKELIELQALTDPDYPCDPLSNCSCNS